MKKKIISFLCSLLCFFTCFNLCASAKTTTSPYKIFDLSSKNVVTGRVDYFDVGALKTVTFGFTYNGYPVGTGSVWRQAVEKEMNLLEKSLYFDYWIADKKNNYISGGTVKMGGKIKTPLKGKRIYITTRISPDNSNFVKKSNKIYAKTYTAYNSVNIKYSIRY